MKLKFQDNFIGLIQEGLKIHTIRKKDEKNWQVGDVIDMTNTEGAVFHTEKCLGIQEIKIRSRTWPRQYGRQVYSFGLEIDIDGKPLSPESVMELSIKDGFDSPSEFAAYFTERFDGRWSEFNGILLHWTRKKY